LFYNIKLLEYIKLCSQRYLGNASLRIARILCGGRTLYLPCYVVILLVDNVYSTSHRKRRKNMDWSLTFAINVKKEIRLISKSKMQIIIFKKNIIRSKKSPNLSLKENYSLARNTSRKNWPDTVNLTENSSVWIVWMITMIMIQKKMFPTTLNIPSKKQFRLLLIQLSLKTNTKSNLFKNSRRSSTTKKRPTKVS